MQRQVQVFGDAPGGGREGAGVRHDAGSGDTERLRRATHCHGYLPERAAHTSGAGPFTIKPPRFYLEETSSSACKKNPEYNLQMFKNK